MASVRRRSEIHAAAIGARQERVWSYPRIFVALAALSLAAWLLAPWPLQAKALATLHGICAQRPSHSFWFDGGRPSLRRSLRLPFDARMTGIYAGFLLTQLTLLARGRFRAGRLPRTLLVVALVVFVVAMGVDGFNSLLVDLRLPWLYPPSNLLRYVTGALSGSSLGAMLWLLLGAILWQPSPASRRPVFATWRDLALPLLPIALFGAMAVSGRSMLYAPLAVTLVLAAVLVVFEFALIVVQLARLRERTARSLSDLAGPALTALPAAYLVLFLLSTGRYMLESILQLRPLS